MSKGQLFCFWVALLLGKGKGKDGDVLKALILAFLQEPSSPGQRERVVEEKHLQGEFLLCTGYFSRVDKEHNKCGKMTYFVEKLNISPDA